MYTLYSPCFLSYQDVLLMTGTTSYSIWFSIQPTIFTNAEIGNKGLKLTSGANISLDNSFDSIKCKGLLLNF